MTTLNTTLPARVSPLVGLRQTASLAWRGLVQIRHNPMELGDLSFQPIMFVLLFTYLFGGAVMGDPVKYLQFMLPGIIVQSGLMATMNTGMGLSTDLHKGFFDRLQSLPIARWSPLAGRVVSDVVKQGWSMTILLATGYLIGFRATQGVVAVLAAFGLMLTFSLLASWFAVFCGTIADEPEKVMMYGFTAIFPLSFLSNAYVPTATLPGWLQAFVKINPVTQLGDALRGLLTGGPVAQHALLGLLGGLVIAVICAPLALLRLKRR
ncbi:transport permease protein [Rhizocola hellebori]|uniref:Transport permease protein n=1 Tax=Rhizocola hellebori TaxID=1392758 RepID=A0A8J3Q7B8_9ACTN|nr:ABC transporter permease [Rhizocola hellebori]GIH04598.1 transport permease protein [Rhizocola hellebori]